MIGAMRDVLRKGGLALGMLVVGSAAAVSQAPRSSGDRASIPVMSDTPQWCAHLAEEVAGLRRVATRPHETADRLARDGQQLCGTGHVRLGIMRLRYALMQLEAP